MNERQRLNELAFLDVQKFWTEMLIVLTKFCEREQEEFADSLGFAIRAVVSKDSTPLPDSEFRIEFAGVRYGARRLGDAVLRDGRKLTFLGRNSTATHTFEEVFSDYAAAAGHVLPGLPGKWQDEIDFTATPESRWLAYLFLSEKRTEDHTWLRPISTSLVAVEKLIAGPEKPHRGLSEWVESHLKAGQKELVKKIIGGVTSISALDDLGLLGGSSREYPSAKYQDRVRHINAKLKSGGMSWKFVADDNEAKIVEFNWNSKSSVKTR